MYQALYRKYRPKNFDEVAGQEVVIKTLKNSILNNKISHAYLFSGPRGCGKTSVAKIFAKVINCENLDGVNPCNECVNCTQSSEQNMDVIEMDAASNNGVDEIREIKNKVNLVPTFGKYKIYIIDEVHMLTIGAFNALLKTLEEPPSHAIFILATTDPQKVPITILSRCQKFEFKKISNAQIFDKLKNICEKEKVSIESQAIYEIARLGDGSLRDALSILDQTIAYEPENITVKDVYEVNGIISQKEISELFLNVSKNDISAIIKKLEHYSSKGKNSAKISEEIILFLRNLLLVKLNSDLIEEVEDYAEVENLFKKEEILEYLKILNETLIDIKKFSNSMMLLEIYFIKIVSAFNNKNCEKKLKEEGIKKEENLLIKEKNISREIISPVKNEYLNEFIDLRVNNTLSNFSKVKTIEFKKELNKLNDYLMDDNYKSYALILKDGELKAVGGQYIIFSFKTPSLAVSFNEAIPKMEELLFDIFKYKYRVIAVDEEKWNEIKTKFNSKKEKFEFIEEKEKINDIIKKIKNNEDGIKSLFKEVVEYEEEF